MSCDDFNVCHEPPWYVNRMPGWCGRVRLRGLTLPDSWPTPIDKVSKKQE